MTTVGFIYPDHAAEDDYPLAEKLLGGDVRLAVAHIYGTDLHAVPELLDLGSDVRLAEGARLLADDEPDAVVWACTSGSFVYGPTGAARQVEKLAAVARKPASSTSFAFVRAAKTLGIRNVAIAASYPDDVAKLFVDFLDAGGISVVSMAYEDIDTAAEVGRLPEEQVIELAVRHDNPAADAVLIPDTAMRTVGVVNAMEERIGKPVLTANQVTVWEGLRLAGALRTSDALGTLFREPVPGRGGA